MSDEDGGGGWCPIAKRCVASRRSKENQTSALIEQARVDANSDGYARAIVVERGRIWIWRHDWLVEAMTRDAERRGRAFKNVKVTHVVQPDSWRGL